MALTFDDGPSPFNTPIILDELRRFGVKATFFVVGVNVRAFPDIARRIVDEGHEIGNHSVFHSPYRSSALANQIGPNQAIIRDATGVVPVANRAPGLTRGSAILQSCAQHGLYEAHTHMDSLDWTSPRRSAWSLHQHFVRKHRNGALALYHDGGSRRPTPDAVGSILAYGRSIGYDFMTATQLINSGTPLPASHSYLAETQLQDAGDGIDVLDSAEEHVLTCQYDARAELVRMLDSSDALVRTARSRIVEALADMDAAARRPAG